LHPPRSLRRVLPGQVRGAAVPDAARRDLTGSGLGVGLPARRRVRDALPARDAVLEEDLPDEFAAAADAGLGEDRLEVVLDGVRRQVEPVGDLPGGAALDAQPGDRLLPAG